MKSYMMKNFIVYLTEQLIMPRYSKTKVEPNIGLYFLVRISSECLGYEEDGNTHHPEWEGKADRYLHIIITSRNNVFLRTDIKRPRLNSVPQDGWKNTSNHSSCWTEGLNDLTRLGFDCWEEAFKNKPEDKITQNKDADTAFEFCIFSKIFRPVEVETEIDRELDSSGYFKKVTSVKIVEIDLKV